MANEFFVDANIIIYSVVPSVYQGPCLEILTAIARGSAKGHTSPAVLEEVWYIELSGKAGTINGLAHDALTLFSPLLPVTEECFRLAFSLSGPLRLGTNDRLHLGTCLAHGIGTIASADLAFDSASPVRRVDPLDALAWRQLIG